MMPTDTSAGNRKSDSDWEKTCKIIDKLNPYFLTIDVANGYSSNFVNFCKKVREQYPQLTIFAGNVAPGIAVKVLSIYGTVSKTAYPGWRFFQAIKNCTMMTKNDDLFTRHEAFHKQFHHELHSVGFQ